jgi:hypothetical protein
LYKTAKVLAIPELYKYAIAIILFNYLHNPTHFPEFSA